MFETVAVESKPHPIRKGRVATLPVSIALHALAISGVIASNVWSVSFPTNSPAQYESFHGAQAVPVPPEQEQPRRVEPPQPKPEQRSQESIFTERPAQNPTTATPIGIPDTIPDVEAGGGGLPEIAVGDPSLAGPGGGESQVGSGGEPVAVGPGRATMPVILKRVQPIYPKMLVAVGLKGSAVVECVVGRDGAIESARVVRATHPLFGDAARDAVLQWKFLPGRLSNQPVATIFQLTVNFEVKR
ncbi:MAG: TonB family protein [Acidobacteria bacterium]|nr:TonB family protein [Acidobacteriota bacterium]